METVLVGMCGRFVRCVRERVERPACSSGRATGDAKFNFSCMYVHHNHRSSDLQRCSYGRLQFVVVGN
jgi:hypothetical protein